MIFQYVELRCRNLRQKSQVDVFLDGAAASNLSHGLVI